MKFDEWWEAGGGGEAGKDACERAWQAATENAAKMAEDEAKKYAGKAIGFVLQFRRFAAQLRSER